MAAIAPPTASVAEPAPPTAPVKPKKPRKPKTPDDGTEKPAKKPRAKKSEKKDAAAKDPSATSSGPPSDPKPKAAAVAKVDAPAATTAKLAKPPTPATAAPIVKQTVLSSTPTAAKAAAPKATLPVPVALPIAKPAPIAKPSTGSTAVKPVAASTASTSSFTTARHLSVHGPAAPPPLPPRPKAPLRAQDIGKEEPYVLYQSGWKLVAPCLLFTEFKSKSDDNLRALDIVRDLALKHNVIAGISDEGLVYCLTSSDNRVALTKRLEQLGLMVRGGGNVGGVPSSVAESALQTYVAMKVSEKGWHRVGRYYARGDLLGNSVVDVALVRMEIHLSAECTEVSVSLSPSIGRSAPFSVESIVGSDKLMKELDKGLEVTHGQIGPDQKRCSVLPGLTIASIQSVCRKAPATGPFAKVDDLRRYWRVMHAYDLPPIQEYVTVKFSDGGAPLTYPSSCIWSPLGMPELRTRARAEGEAVRAQMLETLKAITAEGSPFANLRRIGAEAVGWTKCRSAEE